MLDFSIYRIIADDVYESLNIPEDIYLTFDDDSATAFYNQYVRDDDYIEALVDIELQKYDVSDNIPDDIEDIRDNAVDEVSSRLEQIYDSYLQRQEQLKNIAYNQIVRVLKDTAFDGIEGVDVEFEKADPEVGMWYDQRDIIFTLTNGQTITFHVDFEE